MSDALNNDGGAGGDALSVDGGTGGDALDSGNGTGGVSPADGGGKSDFPTHMQTYPDEFKKDGFFSGFKDHREQLGNHKKLAEENSSLKEKAAGVLIPKGRKATAEEKAAIRKELGIPDSPDGYTLDAKDLVKGVERDAEFESSLIKLAYQRGTNPVQAQSFLDLHYANEGRIEQAAAEADKQSRETAEVANKEKFGDKLDEVKNIAKLHEEKFPDEFAFLKEHGLHDHPGAVSMMHARVAPTLDDTTVRGGHGTGETGKDTRQRDAYGAPMLDYTKKGQGDS